jgi:hypothetical protein
MEGRIMRSTFRTLPRQNTGIIHIKHVKRDHLAASYNLANLTRIMGCEYISVQLPTFLREHHILEEINQDVFKSYVLMEGEGHNNMQKTSMRDDLIMQMHRVLKQNQISELLIK